MIISASRRTDIPAFYGDWFVNRLKAGYVYTRNPFSRKQITKIPLSPDNVDCIVFWTKNPSDFIRHLDFIDGEGFRYYFLFTLNPYDSSLEKNLPEKSEVLKTFKTLSKRLGKSRVVWRYDPVVLTDKTDPEYHRKQFSYLAGELKGYTEKCIISFLDQYQKVRKNMVRINTAIPDMSMMKDIVSSFSSAAEKNSIKLSSCAGEYDFSEEGAEKGKCIDERLIESLTGYRIKAVKDSSQRKECLCITSRDIGSYNTCLHQCLYCYANLSRKAVLQNSGNYDPLSEMLCDNLKGDETISECKDFQSLKVSGGQKQLF